MSPSAQHPEGVALNQEPVDWQARSQVLDLTDDEIEALAAVAEREAALLKSTSRQWRVIADKLRASLSLGLPDEEGEGNGNV